MFTCLCAFRYRGPTVLCSYLQNNISDDMSNAAIISVGQTAGDQEEFQIFDKHVKAVKPWTCNYANFTLTVVDVRD